MALLWGTTGGAGASPVQKDVVRFPSKRDTLRLHSVATLRFLPYLRLGAPDANRAASAPLSSLIGPRPAGSLDHR